MNNELIVQNINDIDISNLSEKEVIQLADTVICNVNINKLEEKVNEACMTLSNVGEPRFGADLKFIALDNQQRLNIVYNLLNNFTTFKADIKNFKHNKLDCRQNYEYIFNFLLNTKDMISSVIEYGSFKQKENKELNEVKNQLETHTLKYLSDNNTHNN